VSNKDLSIIIVNYNTKDFLKNCLNSIIKNTQGINYEIIVVDNASSDGSLEMLKRNFSEVKLIVNKENLGFAKANNYGIKIAEGKYILLLNSDTLILDNCLYNILKFANSIHNGSVIGCKILNMDKSLQWTCYYAPNLLTELIFFTIQIIKDIWDPMTFWKYMKYWDHKKIKDVDCISGCFLWIGREVFDKVGMLDENFFLYYEDSEFCFRVRKKSNYKIYYFPYSEIVHLKGISSKLNDINTIAMSHCYKAGEYYLNKCYGDKTKKIFKKTCLYVWNLEIFIFSLFKFIDKFRKKIVLLKELRKI